MNPVRPGPHQLQGLPTLTEVVELPPPPRETPPASVPGAPSAAPYEPAPAAAAGTDTVPGLGEAELVERVLGDLQRQAELMLEARLREAWPPILALLTEALVADLQLDLSSALRDLVARAVSQELSRQRER